MLANLDVLIGLSVVMLALSLIVTLIGQMVSNALAVRGTNLRWGLSMLIQELHKKQFPPPAGALPLFGKDLNKEALALVTRILEHPLVSDAKVPLKRWKLATAIRFDEFVKTIGLLARADEALSKGAGQSDAAAQGAGEKSNAIWLDQNSKISEPWFNSVMDRVSQRFTVHMRLYTAVIALFVALLIPVDTLHVVNLLRNDTALRSGLVEAAQKIDTKPLPDGKEKNNVLTFVKDAAANLPPDQDILTLLRDKQCDPKRFTFSGCTLLGLPLSVMLLSLGAPFWFNMLKNLTALRPIVAAKEEKERAAQSPPDAGDGIKWKDL